MHSRSLFLILAFILAAMLVGLAPIPIPQAEPAERNFQVAASSYAFSPAEIRVNPGDLVSIELTSSDVVHGLYIDGYDLQIRSDPGQTETLTFIADRSGTFRFRCSVTCGDLHPFMIGKFHVGSNTLLWRGAGLASLSLLGVIVFGTSKFRNQSKRPKL